MTFSDDIKRVKEELKDAPKSINALYDYAETAQSLLDYKNARIGALMDENLRLNQCLLKQEQKIILLEMQVYQLKSNIS